jgi:hypothetical protein
MSRGHRGGVKGKQKFWRKMSEKQYDGETEIRTGKRLRDAMRNVNHPGIMTTGHVSMMKNAGINTPVLDKLLSGKYNDMVSSDSQIQDVEILEGA